MGGGTRGDVHALRNAHRRAVALQRHDVRRIQTHDDRRGAALLVHGPRRETRLSRTTRRPRRHRTRDRAQAD